MRKLLLPLLVGALALSACGSSSNVAYAPAYWGPHGYCYYLYSPYECYGHHYGVPTLMPLWWHERYASYYDSSSYVGRYVPSAYRSSAYSRARSFERSYAAGIRKSSGLATYRGTNGKMVSGSHVRSSTFGGGGARSGAKSACGMAYHLQLASFSFRSSGSSSSGGSHVSSSSGSHASFGGGSARSGSSGSRSGAGREQRSEPNADERPVRSRRRVSLHAPLR